MSSTLDKYKPAISKKIKDDPHLANFVRIDSGGFISSYINYCRNLLENGKDGKLTLCACASGEAMYKAAIVTEIL